MIISNNISSCETGILILDLQSRNNSILNNLIEYCGTGIELIYTQNNLVAENRIFRGLGIYLSTARDNIIRDNIIQESGLLLYSSTNNLIYNNIFNINSLVVFCYLSDTCSNSWNVTKTPGKNIISGRYMGGNVWLKPDGTGFSQTCEDTNSDGICDLKYQLTSSNIDYLPLKYNFPPIASFTFSPSSPKVNESITFNASSSYDPDGSIVSYLWDFGDGFSIVTSQQAVQHAYSMAGMYTVNLTVVDNEGLWNSTLKTVTVKNAPPSLHNIQPRDLDNDGLYEDVYGDGTFNIWDVVFFFQHYNDQSIQNYPDFYNFDGSDGITIWDVVKLFWML